MVSKIFSVLFLAYLHQEDGFGIKCLGKTAVVLWKVRKTLNLNIKLACKWAVAYIFIVTLPSAGHTSFMM